MMIAATLIVIGKDQMRMRQRWKGWDYNDDFPDNTWRCSKSLIHTTQTVCSQSSPLVSLVYLNIRVRVEIKLKHYDGYVLAIGWSRWFRICSLCGGLWWSGWGSVGRFRKEVWTRRVALTPHKFPRLPTMCDQHKIICTVMALIVVPALFIVRLWNDTL